ncbi:Selenoprotein N, partial [Stegodyphus mimosarum]
MKDILCGILCLIFSVLLYYCFNVIEIEREADFHIRDVTSQIGIIFKKLDKNDDGKLDLTEFSILQNEYKIFHYGSTDSDYKVQEFPYLPIELGEQVINIEVTFKPISLKSLKKDVIDIPKNELGSLQGLLNWTKPFKSQHPFGAKSFSLFLPKDNYIKHGIPWWIIEPNVNKYSKPLSSKRYFPPAVDEKFHALFVLLSLFHPQPFLWTRFAPQGTVAVVRAIEKDFYDILFRIHAEFQLNKPPIHPFWFTPSQFCGRIIINKDGTVVKFFHMELPDTRVNVDMEWLNGPTEDSMEVDIGYIPQMSLMSNAISVPSSSERGANQSVSTIKWDVELPFEEAFDALELQLFPFKKVKYYNISEAFDRAKMESKLVHGIILWGNLDDQSC